MRLLLWILLISWVAWKRADWVRNRQTLLFSLALLLLPQLIRLLFILIYPEHFAVLGVKELLSAAWKGIPFDVLMLSLLGGPGLLLLNLPIVNTLYRKSVALFCALLFEFYALVLVSDLVYFSYVQRHVGADIFNFFLAVPLVLDLAIKSYFWVCLGLVVLFGFGMYAAWKYAARAKPIYRGNWFYELFFLVLLFSFLWFGEKGYLFGDKPMSPRLAYVENLTKGHLVLNGAFNICHHLMPKHFFAFSQTWGMDHPVLRELNEEESLQIAQDLLGSVHEKWQNADFPLQRERTQFSFSEKKRNLIIFALESLDFNSIDSIAGTHHGATPHLDALIRQGQVFDHFSSCGDSISLIGIGTIMLGLCWMNGMYFSRGLEQNTQNGLGRVFERAGYESVFVRACKDTVSYIGPLAQLMGFKTFGRDEIQSRTGKSSIHDADALTVLAEEFQNSTKPFFGFFFSTATHEPFSSWGPKTVEERIDKQFPEESYLRALAYTDNEIGKFIEFLKDKHLYENTAFVIVGDHPKRGPRSAVMWENYRVPMILVAPGVLPPKRLHTVSGQADLLPTLVDLFHLQGPYTAIGKSLLEEPDKDWTFVIAGGEDFAFITPQSFVPSSRKEDAYHKKIVALGKTIYTVLKGNRWAQ